MIKSVLIGGGTGFIGSSLTHLLEKKGYLVYAISRKAGPNRVTWFDIEDYGLPDDIDAVINLTGQNVLDVTKLWTSNFKKEVIESRVNTTKLLAEVIDESSQKPKLFVTISGVGIYKPDDSIEYNENSNVGEPFDFISTLAHDWENAAKLNSKEVRQVTIRSGVVIGRNGGMIKQLYWPYYFFMGGPIGKGNQYLPWIHVHDLCRMFYMCIKNPKISGILNGVAPQIVTNKEFARILGAQMWRPAIIPVPEFAVKLLFGNDRANMLLKGQKVIPKKATKDLLFKYYFPELSSACAEIARLDYRMSDFD